MSKELFPGLHQNLLNNVGSIIRRSQEIARLKGETFNVFSILGIERKENKTHSNLIASLLDPEAEHGLGDKFLKLFYEIILDEDNKVSLSNVKKKIIVDLKRETVKVRVEEYLGRVNYEEVEGGRVDIILEGIRGKIYIENKIFAGDGEMQVARYCKRHEEECKVVFYLSLDGSEPNKTSSGNFKPSEDFFLLSYKTDIRNWLEKCQKEAADYPVVRETIKQYLILIKHLTGQLTSNKMEEKIIELLIRDKQTFDAAKCIHDFFWKASERSFDKIISNVTEILHKNNLSCNREKSSRGDGFFIPIIQIEKFDIGINVELTNNYFFFCAIEIGEKRNPTLNGQKRFDAISEFLIDNFHKNHITCTRYGYALAGRFNFEQNFTDEMRFSNNIDSFCSALAGQILDYINKSRIKEFNKQTKT